MIVYTTVIGNTDELKEPLNPSGVRFVCFADRDIESRHWEIIRVEPTNTPNRQHHEIKQLSHECLDCDVSLWIDAAFVLRVDPCEVMRAATRSITGFKHPDRTRISQEAHAIVKAGKGLEAQTFAQLNQYRADGWDTDKNPQQYITNGGFLLRFHTPEVIRFNEYWHNEVQTKTLRDQMSIDYSAHKTGVQIGHFRGTVRNNDYATLQVKPHKKVSDF